MNLTELYKINKNWYSVEYIKTFHSEVASTLAEKQEETEKMITVIDKDQNGNLTNSKTQVEYFTGGEVNIPNIDEINPTAVIMTGASAEELMLAAMVADVAHKKGNPFTLLLPYLPAARADRGTPFGGKIYADVINTIKAEKVVCLDPHSEIVPNLINNITIVDTTNIIVHAILEKEKWAGIISPDEGGIERALKIANKANLPLIKGSKHRDFKTHELSGFDCEALPDPNGKYLIIDDICDSGGTILGLVEAINCPPENLALWVTHGVFADLAARLNDHIGTVYTTNSHPGSANPLVEANVIDLTTILLDEVL